MAEALENEDRTEEPTARRLQKAREDGEAPRSVDVPAATVTIAALSCMIVLGPRMFAELQMLLACALVIDLRALESGWIMPAIFARQLKDALWAVSPLFLVTIVAAIFGSGVTGGYIFASKLTSPNFGRLDPISGIKRIFGMRAVVEVLKNTAKCGLVIGFLVWIINDRLLSMIGIGAMSLEPALGIVGHEVLRAGLLVAGTLVLIALFDGFYQRYSFAKRMRMTKQEIRDELKEMEGRPEVKQQIRRRQREMASARMIDRVKEADVVITNPQHFAVALAYDPAAEGAPLMLAKGADAVAARMREEAARHGVHIFEAAPLARALFFTTKPGQTIPEALYYAAAQVIAYVFHLNSFEPGNGQVVRPVVDVPADMRFNSEGERDVAEAAVI